MSKIKMLVSFLLLVVSMRGLAQKKVSPNLSVNMLEAVNRSVTIMRNSSHRTVVQVSGRPGSGIVWVKGFPFKTGVIEFDVKGKDVLQKSFVGIAFQGSTDTTYQAIYFRPFNFRATDPDRFKHAVQYIAFPGFDWPYLREKKPDLYEASMHASVDPNEWFHVKVDITCKKIRVFVNDAPQPVLEVAPLVACQTGKIGFWTGNNSDGSFSNLQIKAGDR